MDEEGGYKQAFPSSTGIDIHLEVNLAQQVLTIKKFDQVLQEFLVSTAKNGAGELIDSECTPRGRHQISEKIGADQPLNTIFVGRKPTGEIYTAELHKANPKRDWILTRILWLKGCEPGKNLGGNYDTYERYIYIHGCPDTTNMTIPGSHGCIRMKNDDLIILFDQVSVGTRVDII